MGTNESQSAISVQPGDVLAGKYKVERVLGMGGMGVVVAAQHLELDERVAIKFLLPEALQNDEAVARFAREAKAAVKIKSEHVARVIDVGKLPTGSPYIVMEYLEGEDLSAWVEKRGALPVGQAVDFILQVCEAIAEAHAIGIVHRDLKPANLFCIQRTDGPFCVKVLDFGISKVTLAGMDATRMTRTRAVVGSPHYMSPEQMTSSKEVDSRSDIWSLGVILYELLCGRPPFDAGSITELAIKVATQAPAALRTLREEVPEGLERAVLKCLEKDRAVRYPSIADLATDLLPFAPPESKLSVDRVVGTLLRAGVTSATRRLDPGSLPDVSVAIAASGGAAALGPGAPPPSDGDVTPGPARTQTQSAFSSTSPWNGHAGAALVGAGAFFMLAIGAVAGGLLWHGARTAVAVAGGPAPLAQSVAAPATEAPAADAGVPRQVVSAPLPTPSAAPTVAVASVPDKPPAASPRPARPSSPAPGTAVKPGRAGAKPNCDPPYYFDANGTKHFRKECV